jgi:hypothetical protein
MDGNFIDMYFFRQMRNEVGLKCEWRVLSNYFVIVFWLLASYGTSVFDRFFLPLAHASLWLVEFLNCIVRQRYRITMQCHPILVTCSKPIKFGDRYTYGLIILKG